MSSRTSLKDNVRIELVAAGPLASSVADVLATRLHIPLADAAARLARGPGPLTGPMPRHIAQRLARLLGVIGARVTIRAGGQDRICEARFDIALHPCAKPASRDALIVMARIVQMPEEVVMARLALPSGLIVTGLTWAEVERWSAALPRHGGVRLVISDPGSARYDLFSLVCLKDQAVPAALTRQLKRLGISRCLATGALASDLTPAMRDHLMRRYWGAGLLAINRDFQRFDLMLLGTDGLSRVEMADFLATRVTVSRAALNDVGPAAPICIEHGLTRAQALAFQGEYTAIGLHTRLRLCGLPPAARQTMAA